MQINEEGYPGCCGATVLYGFGYCTSDNIEQLKSRLEEYEDEDGYMVEIVLADYQVGDIEPESDNYEGSDGGDWKDKTWLPTLKELGFRFAGRFRNGEHSSQCFVFQRITGSDEREISTPPKGW